MKRAFFAAVLLVLAACGTSPGDAAPAADTAASAPAERVDSVLPREEEMRRFTAGLGAPPERLEGGEASLEALARAHLRATSRGDTAALRRMLLTRAEFAHLYYPHTPLSRPPYDLAPGLMWLQLTRASDVGAGTVLADLRGRSPRFRAVRCAAKPEAQGSGTVHAGCAVRFTLPGEGEEERVLFGPVLERDGRFKFVSYGVPE
ncbi:MAG TPA: hypothetical protein VF263_10875 [Longimicrobiaceae bacterium]